MASYNLKNVFDLPDENAVQNLTKNLHKEVKAAKDRAWNNKNINSVLLQGVQSGQSITKIANNLSRVTAMNKNSSVRNARTMMTGASNLGRLDQFRRAQENGVVMKKVWVSGHGDRTRDWHRDLDGKELEIDEEFVNAIGKILYPGDSSADGANVYNCRCTLKSKIIGFLKNDKMSYIESNNQDVALYNKKEINQYDSVIDRLNALGIKRNTVNALHERLSESTIIDKIGGTDVTGGSCFSQALAYCGNKFGYDVIDYRGGKDLINLQDNFEDIMKSTKGCIIDESITRNSPKKVGQYLKRMTDDEEYLIATREHAFISRRQNVNGSDTWEYLELQDEESGWIAFTRDSEGFFEKGIQRFLDYRCGKINKSYIAMLPVQELNTNDFKDVLGFLNNSR